MVKHNIGRYAKGIGGKVIIVQPPDLDLSLEKNIAEQVAVGKTAGTAVDKQGTMYQWKLTYEILFENKTGRRS